MFLFKKNVKYFCHIRVGQYSFFVRWSCLLLWKLLFRDILRMNFHIDFIYSNISIHKWRKQPTKYQHLGIAPSTESITKNKNKSNKPEQRKQIKLTSTS